MTVEIDRNSGFCKGVIRAIDGAERLLAEGGVLYSLGAIVHNEAELARLRKKGLSIVYNQLTAIFICQRFYIRLFEAEIIGIKQCFSLFQIDLLSKFQMDVDMIELKGNMELLKRTQNNITSVIRDINLFISTRTKDVF